MDDIVDRLREVGLCGWRTQQDAADEIERLRALIREWDEANNFGRLDGDELTAAVDRLNASEQALIKEANSG